MREFNHIGEEEPSLPCLVNINVFKQTRRCRQGQAQEFVLWFCSWGFFCGDGMTQGYFFSVYDNALLEISGLPHVLPLTVQLDFGHLPDTQGYLGLLSEPYTPSQTL